MTLATARALPREGRRPLLWLAGVTAVGAGLRFATLGTQSFWYDEGQTVDVVRMHLGSLLTSGVPDTQNFPPLYFLLAWAWVKVFSLDEVGLRSLSALCGTVTVPAMYGAGAVMASRRVGLVAAALAATSPLLVWYSQEARPYALFMAFGALSLWLFARARQLPSHGRVLAWAVAAGLALLTHYFAVFLMAGEAALLLVSARRARRARVLAGAIGGLALLAAALLPLALHQRSSGRGESISATPLLSRARVLPNRFLLGEQGGPLGDYGRAHYLLFPLALLVAVALWAAWQRTRGSERSAARTSIALAAVTWIGPLALAVIGYDYVVERNLIAAWVPSALLVACGLGALLRQRSAGAAVTGLFAALSVAMVAGVDATPHLQRDDWRAVGQALCAPHGGRALVVTPYYSLTALRFYAPSVRPLSAGPQRRFAEVDVVGMRPTGWPALPGPALQGASIASVRTSTYVVLRFGLRYPRPLSAALLASLRLPVQGAGTGPALLLEQPAAPLVNWSSRCTA